MPHQNDARIGFASGVASGQGPVYGPAASKPQARGGTSRFHTRGSCLPRFYGLGVNCRLTSLSFSDNASRMRFATSGSEPIRSWSSSGSLL